MHPIFAAILKMKISLTANLETFAILQGLEVVNSAKVTCIIIHSGSASIGGSGNTRNEDIQGHPKKGEGSKELEFCDLDPNFWASKCPKLKCRPRKNPENRLLQKWPFWCCISVLQNTTSIYRWIFQLLQPILDKHHWKSTSSNHPVLTLEGHLLNLLWPWEVVSPIAMDPGLVFSEPTLQAGR